MILYLDTSAIVPILIAESSTDACQRIWRDADRRVSSRLAEVEVAAALAMAERRARIRSDEHDAALANLAEILSDVDIVELAPDLVVKASRLARSQALRGYDAVHCASAIELNDDELVAASGDLQLLAAWRALGVHVFDTSQSV